MKTKQKGKPKIFLLYFRAYLPSLLWASLIFVLSNQQKLPGFDLSLVDFIFKKSAHIFVYAVLYYMLFLAYLKTNPSQPLNKKHYLIPLIIGIIYALSDELHQSTVKGRYPNVRDVAYDFLGMMSILLHQQKLL